MEINTDTNNVGQVLLEQYHLGQTEGTFRVSLEDPPTDTDPKTEVRGVTIIYAQHAGKVG